MTVFLPPVDNEQGHYVLFDETGTVVEYGLRPRPEGDPRLYRVYESEQAIFAAFPQLGAEVADMDTHELHAQTYGELPREEIYRAKREQALYVLSQLENNVAEASITAPFLRAEAQIRNVSLSQLAQSVVDASELDPDLQQQELNRVAARLQLPGPAGDPPQGQLRTDDELPEEPAEAAPPMPFTLEPYFEPGTNFTMQPYFDED